ncbi:hypothetical protein Nepgr_009414 [Nepenthes gracilis]|uniref:Uncharacterized protein n=1 Tax=Nepenthes gracilis TaxID=150966 RepID=A0AAD3XKB4_NEPGR|nr:hypothetical protein Nepgr_009414 [Nepenthes gracilis]
MQQTIPQCKPRSRTHNSAGSFEHCRFSAEGRFIGVQPEDTVDPTQIFATQKTPSPKLDLRQMQFNRCRPQQNNTTHWPLAFFAPIGQQGRQASEDNQGQHFSQPKSPVPEPVTLQQPGAKAPQRQKTTPAMTTNGISKYPVYLAGRYTLR